MSFRFPPLARPYGDMRFHNIMEKRFRHVLLLLYWPAFLLMFLLMERFIPHEVYYPVWCPLDDVLPFNELFVIPYLMWFGYLVLGQLWTLLYDVRAFRRTLRFIIMTFTLTSLIYMVWPTCQQLRPATMPRDNLLTKFIGLLYAIDTSTNVCPSLHVIGSSAICCGLWDAKGWQGRGMRVVNTVLCALISVSTVMIKQHSAVDVLAAIPICAAAWWLVYRMDRPDKE